MSFAQRLEWSKEVNRMAVGRRASQADRIAGAKALGWDHLGTLENNVVRTKDVKDNSEVREQRSSGSCSTYLSKIRIYWIVLHWFVTWSDNVFKLSFYTENRLWLPRGRGLGEFGTCRCKPLYIEWINNKALWYSTRNYIQYLVINRNGKEHRKRFYTYRHICMTHFAVQ